MKPFDLEKALKGDPVITRGGDKVVELHFFEKVEQPIESIFFLLEKENDHIFKCQKNGKYLMNEIQSEYDLFMATKTKILWLSVEIDKLPLGLSPDCYETSRAYVCKEDVPLRENCQLIEIKILE